MTAKLTMTADEAERLKSLHRLLVLDSEPEPLFDTIARMAAETCETPIALITLIDADRQWVKASHGAQPLLQTPRDISFCTHAIEGPGLFQVPDASIDERFRANPLVTESPHFRFYAGMPLTLADGQRVGTLCVVDHRPRLLDETQAARLQLMATMTVQAMEMRHDLIRKTCGESLGFENISEKVRFQEEQLRQASVLRSIVESIPGAVAVVGPDGRFRFANRLFNSEVPCDGLPVEGRSMREVLGEDLWLASRSQIDKALAGELVVFEKEPGEDTRHQHLAISYFPVIPAGGAPDGFVTIAHDVTRQKHEENRLRHLSQRDPLTGLLNRAGLEMYVQQSLCDPAQDRAQLGLLYIDLDRFKPVNDTYGHPVGDELLKQFAQRLSKLVRPTDAVVRHGGDEFAVVLKNVRDIAGLATVADKVVAVASTPFLVMGKHLRIGASVGFARGIDDAGGWAGLMKRADDMLYKAKTHGRGRRMGEAC